MTPKVVNLPETTKIPESRVNDLEIEEVVYKYGQDSHVQILWGYKKEETGHTLLVEADKYNEWLQCAEKLEFEFNDSVRNMSLEDYWDEMDAFFICDDARLFLKTYHVERADSLPDLPAIVMQFPNPNTYPVTSKISNHD